MGISDARIAEVWHLDAATGADAGARAAAHRSDLKPVFKLVDTCAAEFESKTPVSLFDL